MSGRVLWTIDAEIPFCGQCIELTCRLYYGMLVVDRRLFASLARCLTKASACEGASGPKFGS